jgi:DNA polymerase-3 subunit delta'
MMAPPKWPIIGHEWAVELLQRSIATDHIAHAYLLAGPPQIGKSTLALTFAQALNCVGQDPPCGQCRACRLIASGRYPDVRLVETERAASGERKGKREISIDQVRALQHEVNLKPYEGRWKVAIIAGAEELSLEAANALLKTLEEPPPQVVLILTATSSEALLPTIVSRCQLITLRPLPAAASESALLARGVPAERARLLSRLAEGRIGWAIQASQDESLLIARQDTLAQLVRLSAARRSERLAYAQVLAQRFGRDGEGPEEVGEILDLWAVWWRDVLLVQEGCPELVVNVDREEVLRREAGRCRSEQSRAFLQALRQTQEQLAQNVNARLALEVLLLSVPAGSG